MGTGGGAVVEAVLWMGGEETPYRRAGRGRPVLLLLDATDGEDAELFTTLAAEFRVIAPGRLPAAGWDVWLRDLIDGLGLDRPVLVVGAAPAAEVEQCARVDPGRIRGVVVRPRSAAELLAAVRHAARGD